jgi:hypothetical protein
MITYFYHFQYRGIYVVNSRNISSSKHAILSHKFDHFLFSPANSSTHFVMIGGQTFAAKTFSAATLLTPRSVDANCSAAVSSNAQYGAPDLLTLASDGQSAVGTGGGATQTFGETSISTSATSYNAGTNFTTDFVDILDFYADQNITVLLGTNIRYLSLHLKK